MPVTPSYGGKHKQEDHVPDWPGIKQDPISKITNTKMVGGVAEVVV
jgi:hypothetical protein